MEQGVNEGVFTVMIVMGLVLITVNLMWDLVIKSLGNQRMHVMRRICLGMEL